MKPQRKTNYLYCLTSLVFLSLLLIVLSGCEKKSLPEKVTKEKTEEIRPGEINLSQIRLAAIPEDYDNWSNISFSIDGTRVFYEARKKDKAFIVVASTSGQNIGPAYKSVSFLTRSPDGHRFAFGGGKGKKRLVVDNKELRDVYDQEVAPSAFSPDSRFVACEVGDIKEKEWFIVVSDGEKEVYRSGVYPDTWRQPAFSPDGRLLVYELGDDKTKIQDKKRTLFFLDVSSLKIIKKRVYTDYETGKIYFSSDSSRVIYDVRKDDKLFLVLYDFALDEERQVEFHPSTGEFVLSPDGKHVVYIATKEGKQYLIASPWESPSRGKEVGPYEAIAPPVFGPGSNTVACLAMEGGKWRTVIGNKEGAKYDGISGAPVFSSDGAKLAYPAMKGGHKERRGMIGGKWVMVVSHVGKPAAVKEGPAYDMVVTPVFSPDGKRIAYRARTGTMENGRRFIVIADTETGKLIKEGSASDEVWPPVWSADSKTVAYGTRQGCELWWRVETVQ